ncbi:MAG: DNA polymerase III subunit delta' [Desulfovibrionaceae bacterium]|nr:DNA polymerase III subunit delta' [Desulfovibrionaceae bacterium]
MSKPASRKAGSAARKTPEGDAPVRQTSAPDEDSLPDSAAMQAMLAPVRAFAVDPEHARVRAFLERLASGPPQVLLLEGGSAPGRLAAAHYWMLLLNCEQRSAPAPCLDCAVCRGMVSHLHRDCFFLDGLAGSIKIDDVRALRSVLGEPPRETRYRTVLFREAQALGEAAANSLLKSFEDPRPNTSFILLAPQRERLLSTLVSRSMVLTLPWPLQEDTAAREALAPWEAALCTFLRSGREFFERSGSKGAVDTGLAHALINLCRRAMLNCITARKQGSAPREGLESILARLPELRLRMLDEALAECQDSLLYGVNPVLVVEWLATRMYLLLPRSRAA